MDSRSILKEIFSQFQEMFSFDLPIQQSFDEKGKGGRNKTDGLDLTKPCFTQFTIPIKAMDLEGVSGDLTLYQFRLACLQAHNARRARHGAAPLTLSDDLNSIAQNYADRLGKSGKFEHSQKKGLGENLAGNSEFDINSGKIITDRWYGEIINYNFSKPGFSMGTGHFTQVVWNGTKELGIGVSKNNATGMYVFVAKYRPPGNMLGAFEGNVNPLSY